MAIEQTGKCKNAHDRLKTIDSKVQKVISRLSKVAGALNAAVIERITEFGKIQSGDGEAYRKGIKKYRSAVEGLPERIEFFSNGLPFYIDFGITTLEREGLISIDGCVVYGVYRPLCFMKCILPEQMPNTWAACGRISRCDRFEDKPLMQFSVNHDGIIRSRGELDDQWGITDDIDKKERNKIVLDLHYRTLDYIWKDALDWTNETILP